MRECTIILDLKNYTYNFKCINEKTKTVAYGKWIFFRLHEILLFLLNFFGTFCLRLKKKKLSRIKKNSLFKVHTTI